MHFVYFVYLSLYFGNKNTIVLDINVHKFKAVFNDILCNIFSVIVFANVVPAQNRGLKILNNLDNNIET